MGIKIAITKDELPLKYKRFNLIETQDGVSHSVYLLDDRYVLKILENISLETVQNEQKILKKLEELSVPQIVDIYQNEKYYLVFYTQVNGESIYKPENIHIKQIALFLKEFHSISKHISSTNTQIYSNKYLEKLVQKTKNLQLKNYFSTINCHLKNDGVIHGDLFCDNAKFQNDILSGVYDFIEACEGDFIFELAVVAISWCFENTYLNEKKIKILLVNYGLDLLTEQFKEYIKYALLYYIAQRYIHNRDYQQLLVKLENL